MTIAEKKKKLAAKKAKKAAKAKRIGTAKPSLAKLKKKLWELLSPAVKSINPKICFTCGAPGNQCGHMFPKGRSHALSAWHPDNLKPQCFYCNINLGGNGAEFARRYIERYGQEEFDKMRRLSQTSHKWTAPEIETLIERIKIGIYYYSDYYDAMYGGPNGALNVAME